MTKPDPFRYFKTSREIISLAVTLYVRFPLSPRNVEDLLHERGIDVSHEAVRYWWHRFGPLFAAEIKKRGIAEMKSSRWCWHLDEVFVKVDGNRQYLWRAVDQRLRCGFRYSSSILVAFTAGGFKNAGRANEFKRLRGGERSIPVPSAPPLALAKAFSRSGCGRIFPLYSRVMRVGPSTDPVARRPGSGLSGPIFSGPHDCRDLVNSL